MATTEHTLDHTIEPSESPEMTLLGVGLGFVGLALIAKEKLFLGAVSLVGGALISFGAPQRIAEVFHPEAAPPGDRGDRVVEVEVVPAAVKRVAAKSTVTAAKPTAKKVAQKPARPAAKKSSRRRSASGDDLKKIEGIGPKVAEVLGSAGLESFSLLAESTTERLREILAEAGSRYRFMDPSTWPEQASLAAAGRWDDLSALQDELKGGRRIN